MIFVVVVVAIDDCRVIHFVYFGLKFIQANINVSSTIPNILTVTDIQALNGGMNFIHEIEDDVKSLNSGCFGGKTVGERNDTEFDEWMVNGCFHKSVRSPDTFYYYHTYHATFSTIHLSQIERLIRLPQYTKNCDECIAHTSHYRLQPFFLDNDSLRVKYQKKLDSGELSDEDQEFLQNALATLHSGTLKDTPYIYNSSRGTCWDYTEDDWTRRLKFCLDEKYESRGLEIILTADNKANGMNPIDVECHEPFEVFPIRGAPDILTRNRALVVTHRQDTEDSSDTLTSADESIEITHQRPPMKSAGPGKLPEKLGELIAALHFLLVCAIIRCKQKQKYEDTASVRGILIDKIVGTVSCKLTGGIGKIIAVEEIVVNATNLTAEVLCAMLEDFLL